MRRLLVFGRVSDSGSYEYYAGRDPAGKIKWESDYMRAALFTDKTVGMAEDCLNAGYLIFCAAVPDAPTLGNLCKGDGMTS